MSKPEQLGQKEYSGNEILEEIFEKFQKLRGFLDPGKTAHLLINQELLKKLRLHLRAEKFGLAQRMSMKVSYPTYQKIYTPASGPARDIEGELFTLFAADEKTLPLSCVAMPLDKSELKENLDSSKFLAQMSEGPLKLAFSKIDKNTDSFIYLAQLRNGVFEISSHKETLERI